MRLIGKCISATSSSNTSPIRRFGSFAINIVGWILGGLTLLHLSQKFRLFAPDPIQSTAQKTTLALLAASSDLFPTIVKGLVGNKQVAVKVGVLQLEERSEDTFWFEFDPTVPMTLTSQRWLLPFAAATENKESVPFHIHNLSGCSSMFMPSGASSDREAYMQKGQSYCNDFMESHTDKTDWMLWDMHKPTPRGLLSGRDACYQCQNPTKITKTVHFPSLAMKDVIESIPMIIQLLDVDAQGGDFEIIQSIGPAIQRVKEIKMECQDLSAISPIYQTRVPNSCQDAILYLQKFGFKVKQQQLNNCGCAEYNLWMANEEPRVP